MRRSTPKRLGGLFVAGLLALGLETALAQEGGFMAPVDPDGAVSIPVANLGDLAAQEGLQVFVGPASACCEGRTPVSGTYEVVGDVASFTPAFSFVEGQIYTVLLLGEAEREFFVRRDSLPGGPEVVAIYPSGQVIPENTLRFYIEFASPMQPHRAEEFISLENADGRADGAAFMSFKQELWNRDRTRLTLLMDPGRIKRGVATNLELGPALESGQRYTLVIREGWPSANGQGAASEFRAPFVVGAPLRSLPDAGNWTVEAPRWGTRAPLVLRFDRSFDRVQLGHAIVVHDEMGRPVQGSISTLKGETVWRFVPRRSWGPSEVTVVVDASLEDAAGNNFRELLDHAVGTAARTFDQVTLKVKLAAP